MRMTPSCWEAIKFVLPYINRRPWVENEGRRERVVRITFDDFLQPFVEAWRVGETFDHLIFAAPEYDIELITSYTVLPKVHVGLGALVMGYLSKSDMEVEIVHNTLHNAAKYDNEIVMAFGFPLFLVGHS